MIISDVFEQTAVTGSAIFAILLGIISVHLIKRLQQIQKQIKTRTKTIKADAVIAKKTIKKEDDTIKWLKITAIGTVSMAIIMALTFILSVIELFI